MDFIPVCEPLLAGKEKEYVNDALDSGWISSSGKYVKSFEESFATYCRAKYAVTVVNGTAALHLALTALGIGDGDEIILPTFTMMACAVAIRQCGAVPVLVDAKSDTWNIDETKIEEKINAKTKAIMPVHIFGNPCNMEKIMHIAQAYDLFVLEDAAEAHGALYKRNMVGSIGDIGAFSFYANKNLTTGEGGMVTTQSDELYDKLRYYKNLCFPLDGNRNYLHDDIGFNYRFSNLHSAIGLAQLEKSDYYTKRRRENALLYKEHLSSIEGITLQELETGGVSVYWMNSILLDSKIIKKTKEEVCFELKKKNIDTRCLFQGMHRQAPLQKFVNSKNLFPNSDKLSDYGFYLPSGSGLMQHQIEYICHTLKDIIF